MAWHINVFTSVYCMPANMPSCDVKLIMYHQFQYFCFICIAVKITKTYICSFQFVIKASAKRKTNDSPDSLIDWSLIEQINIQTSDEPQCPICLYPPVAAKVTRCGHVYCWTCVLHYLSLSDKTWRKCPICYDAVHVGDLKSASIVQQSSHNVGSQIAFRLMRRKKGSLLIEKYENWQDEKSCESYPYVSSPMEDKLFSKFVLATRADIFRILERERNELLLNVDESCPEFVFVQQALELIKERSEKLGEIRDDENVIQNNDAQTKLCSIGIQCDDENVVSTNGAINATENAEVVPNAGDFGIESSVKAIHSPGKYYYFYQVADGQNIYLHPLNVKMLQATYGSLADGPPFIEARIIQKEQQSMDEDHRRKFTCLGHLPLTCEFSVVEIELLPPYVTEDVIKSFKSDIIHRKKERQRKAREEREREKQINAINDRQMGKLISSAAVINITSSDEFPTVSIFVKRKIKPNSRSFKPVPNCSVVSKNLSRQVRLQPTIFLLHLKDLVRRQLVRVALVVLVILRSHCTVSRKWVHGKQLNRRQMFLQVLTTVTTAKKVRF